MAASVNGNGNALKSIMEEDDDASHNTSDNENQLPKYLSDPCARDYMLNEIYVEEELIKEGPGCNLDSEGNNVVEIDMCQHTIENKRRTSLVENDGIDFEKDEDEN
eukprot:12013753-Ditylum_brightwellii.AAC.1